MSQECMEVQFEDVESVTVDIFFTYEQCIAAIVFVYCNW